jgi:hypothetical protein
MRMMLSLAFALLLAPAVAHAQAPQIDRIDIVEYGIYTAKMTGERAAPNAVMGAVASLGDVQHAVTTRTIPAQQGVRFGFRYKIVGAPENARTLIHIVTIFPSPGLTNPATRKTASRSEYDATATIGGTEYQDYGLDNAWEVVPGRWTMQIWYQGRKLAEQTFTIGKP